MQIGDYVVFEVKTLHGKGKLRGRVTKIFQNGRIEVKVADHGYYMLYADSLMIA